MSHATPARKSEGASAATDRRPCLPDIADERMFSHAPFWSHWVNLPVLVYGDASSGRRHR
jgi:hypothetical protein